MSKTVALLVGGWNAEREVSLNKGKHVENALRASGYDVQVVNVTKDIHKLLNDLTPKPDVVFNNIYGRIGEDGILQGFLEMLEIPYTNSGVLASAISMDKPMTKKLAESVGVRCPKGNMVSRSQVAANDLMPKPYVIKPYNEGSSVDVYIVKEQDNHLGHIVEGWNFGEYAMIEEYIPGKELTVAVLDGKAQTVTEIVSHTGGFFDYEAKYEDQRTELVMPADIPQDVFEAAMDYSERVYKALGSHGIARCDFRYDDTQGVNGLYFLEINNPPGMTAESIGPSQVVFNGMSFNALCAHLVETAKCHGQIKEKQEQSEARSSQSAAARANG